MAKRFVRERVSGSIVVLRGLVRRAITGIDKLYLQRVWQKMWRYIDLHAENVSVLRMKSERLLSGQCKKVVVLPKLQSVALMLC